MTPFHASTRFDVDPPEKGIVRISVVRHEISIWSDGLPLLNHKQAIRLKAWLDVAIQEIENRMSTPDALRRE